MILGYHPSLTKILGRRCLVVRIVPVGSLMPQAFCKCKLWEDVTAVFDEIGRPKLQHHPSGIDDC